MDKANHSLLLDEVEKCGLDVPTIRWTHSLTEQLLYIQYVILNMPQDYALDTVLFNKMEERLRIQKDLDKFEHWVLSYKCCKLLRNSRFCT